MVTQTKAISVALFLFLGACSATSGDPCAGFRPIRPSVADTDTMSGSLVSQILTHNETGKSLCGWQK